MEQLEFIETPKVNELESAQKTLENLLFDTTFFLALLSNAMIKKGYSRQKRKQVLRELIYKLKVEDNGVLTEMAEILKNAIFNKLENE